MSKFDCISNDVDIGSSIIQDQVKHIDIARLKLAMSALSAFTGENINTIDDAARYRDRISLIASPNNTDEIFMIDDIKLVTFKRVKVTSEDGYNMVCNMPYIIHIDALNDELENKQ